MSEKPVDLTTEILVAIRKDIAEFRHSVETRLDRLEVAVGKQRRDQAGMLVMMRATAGDFDQRVRDVEDRVRALEAGEH
jgi:phage-related minor tail protein